jgi:oligopeptide transport system ATP-binding protein
LCSEEEPVLEVKAGDVETHVTACHFPVEAGENLMAAGRREST